MTSKSIPNMSAKIPSELIEVIIDEVASKDDKKLHDLKSCALVCRDFSYPSQRHIFNTITLAMPWTTHEAVAPSEKCLRLHHALSSSPHLALYTRALRIYDKAKCSDILSLPTFPQILAMLTNITTFDLMLRKHCDWNDVTLQAQQALLSLFTSSKLESLELCNIHFFPQASVAWISRIPKVVLRCIRFSSELDRDINIPDHNTMQEGRYLRELHIDDSDIPQPFLDGISRYCRLEKLMISADNISVAANIINSHSSSLSAFYVTNLPIVFSEGDVESCLHSLDQLDIGILGHLRTIQISLPLIVHSDQAPFKYCNQILKKVRDKNDIEKIILYLALTYPPGDSSLREFHWNELDVLLSERRFKGLKEVLLAVGPRYPEGEDTPSDPKLKLWDYLPKLSKRGIVKVNEPLGLMVDVKPSED